MTYLVDLAIVVYTVDFVVDCPNCYSSQEHSGALKDINDYHVIFFFFFQRFYKKAAAFVLRAVAKHSPQLAQSVVDCGALDALVICLEEFDPGVKEAAAWALGYIARHNAGRVNLASETQWGFKVHRNTPIPVVTTHCTVTTWGLPL